MSLHLTIFEAPTDAHRDAVLAPLRAYNAANAPDPRLRPVAILLTNAQGEHVGGLWGRCAYDWLFVEFLVVPQDQRGTGVGTTLIRQAETIARANGCIGIWLDTYVFQARGFYEKLGFDVFGTLDDRPIGQQQYFLRKRLDNVAADAVR